MRRARTGVRTRDRKELARQEVATNKARKKMKNLSFVAAKMYRRYKKHNIFRNLK